MLRPFRNQILKETKKRRSYPNAESRDIHERFGAAAASRAPDLFLLAHETSRPSPAGPPATSGTHGLLIRPKAMPGTAAAICPVPGGRPCRPTVGVP
jgi:hypothetical protein